MKKILLLGLVILTLTACEKQEQRYFSESAEIETLKAGIAAYEAADWEKWRSHWADTAKVYVNSTTGISVDERIAEMKNMTAAMSSYGFNHDEEFIEMVLDKDNKTWVYYWATHNGTFSATNKELTIPVHLAVQFVDGKIVTEHVYFDATEMNAEFAKMAAAEAMMNEMPEE